MSVVSWHAWANNAENCHQFDIKQRACTLVDRLNHWHGIKYHSSNLSNNAAKLVDVIQDTTQKLIATWQMAMLQYTNASYCYMSVVTAEASLSWASVHMLSVWDVYHNIFLI